MISTVDAQSFLVIVVCAALAALAVGLLGKRVAIPVVVLEIVFGIIAGPEVLGLAEHDDFIEFFASLGLAMLFFFAGYEIEMEKIRGEPLKLAAIGWLISLALAYSIGGVLAWAGVVLSLLYTGTAMATTAIGTLLPILSDAKQTETRFGRYMLGAGAVGEFGPIILITIFFSTEGALTGTAILLAFVLLSVAAALVSVRGVHHGWHLFERSLETSAQLAVRFTVVLVFALAALADELGLDLLLGGFLAGVITRQALHGREVEVLESKLIAVGYGFLIPFFFVVTGVKFDLDAIINDPEGLAKLPLFVALFLVVRGVPVLLLYRDALKEKKERMALAIMSSTQLPLVVAITTIAVERGEMKSSTAAALVGAGILSTLCFPLIGLRMLGNAPARADPG